MEHVPWPKSVETGPRPRLSEDAFDKIYQREKKGTLMQVGDEALYDLGQLDSSLDELFKRASMPFESHESMHKFRLSVSRRICSFASILKRLSRQYETSDTAMHQRIKLHTLHAFYQDRLARHKAKLCEWWSRNERTYHSLCLASYVAQSTQAAAPARQVENVQRILHAGAAPQQDSLLVQRLKDTKVMMLTQLDQMDATAPSMLKSSNYIKQHETFLQEMETRFNSARQLVAIVKRRFVDFQNAIPPVVVNLYKLGPVAPTLYKYGIVRSCFGALVGACAFIALRRLRVFKLLYMALKLLVLLPRKLLTAQKLPGEQSPPAKIQGAVQEL